MLGSRQGHSLLPTRADSPDQGTARLPAPGGGEGSGARVSWQPPPCARISPTLPAVQGISWTCKALPVWQGSHCKIHLRKKKWKEKKNEAQKMVPVVHEAVPGRGAKWGAAQSSALPPAGPPACPNPSSVEWGFWGLGRDPGKGLELLAGFHFQSYGLRASCSSLLR